MSKKVVLFGIGDFAQVADVYLTEDSPHDVVAFTVDREYMEDTELAGRPVVAFEDLEELYPPGDFRDACGDRVQWRQPCSRRGLPEVQGERLRVDLVRLFPGYHLE